MELLDLIFRVTSVTQMPKYGIAKILLKLVRKTNFVNVVPTHYCWLHIIHQHNSVFAMLKITYY